VRTRIVVLTTALLGATALSACSSASDDFADQLKKAGFDHVTVVSDSESKTTYNKKKKKNEKKTTVVAYDFDWKVSTDADADTCEVEIEHATNSSGGLDSGGWYIDEVNGDDVGDSPHSPNADAVRSYLTSHNMDC
jgi:hypothetical protein